VDDGGEKGGVAMHGPVGWGGRGSVAMMHESCCSSPLRQDSRCCRLPAKPVNAFGNTAQQTTYTGVRRAPSQSVNRNIKQARVHQRIPQRLTFIPVCKGSADGTPILSNHDGLSCRGFCVVARMWKAPRQSASPKRLPRDVMPPPQLFDQPWR
jgi:hypothetical protein